MAILKSIQLGMSKQRPIQYIWIFSVKGALIIDIFKNGFYLLFLNNFYEITQK